MGCLISYCCPPKEPPEDEILCIGIAPDSQESLPLHLELYSAFLDGDCDRVKDILLSDAANSLVAQRPHSFNDPRFTLLENTFLHAACLSGAYENARLLCIFEADVNVPNKELDTPLHYAASCPDVNVVRLLLVYNANVNAGNRKGQTPLHLATSKACETGDTRAVKMLLNKNARIVKDNSHCTPLDVACEAKNLEITELLLRSKDFLHIRGHVDTLMRALNTRAVHIPLKLLEHVEETSRFTLLVSTLQDASRKGKDMTALISNVDLLLEDKSPVLPGGMRSLIRQAEDLQAQEIAEMLRSYRTIESHLLWPLSDTTDD